MPGNSLKSQTLALRYPAMPLVIPKSGAVHYVPGEEALGEILGHSNFDGYDWAIGDRLIFEAGTESRIKQEPGDLAFTWDNPTPADFEEVKRAIGVPNATDWPELFRTAEVNELQNDLRRTIRALPKAIGCVGMLCVAVLFGLSLVMRIPLWLSSMVVGVAVLIMAAYAGDIPHYRAKIRAAERRGIGEAG